MYGKIFESIYDGSLYGEWEAIVVFKALIVLADQDGNVDLSPQALAGRTSYPLEIIKKGLSVLQRPDPDSRQDAHEGRRIIPLEDGRAFGWCIVNYLHYRGVASRDDKKRADRLRLAEKRKKNNDVAECRIVSQKVAHTDTDTDTDTNTDKPLKPMCSEAARFPDFWAAYPVKRNKKKAREIWVRRKLDANADALIADVTARQSRDRQWIKGFIPLPTTYLNGDRWDDDMEPTAPEKPRSAVDRVRQACDQQRQEEVSGQRNDATTVDCDDGGLRPSLGVLIR